MPGIIIETEELGKEYNFQTIFQQFSHTFSQAQAVSVLGENGSGKSTLLRVLAGIAEATDGRINWLIDGKKSSHYRWFEYLSFCSPDFYFDSRFSVEETLEQYRRVKSFMDDLSIEEIIELIGFQDHRYKYMNELSSGMAQRVRLALAVCADVPVLFLDEPCSNLDLKGVKWYNDLITRFATDKLIFVASNDPREYDFCTESLSLMEYK
jgi:ABC-type multidrug transport system ATPase subunit